MARSASQLVVWLAWLARSMMGEFRGGTVRITSKGSSVATQREVIMDEHTTGTSLIDGVSPLRLAEFGFPLVLCDDDGRVLGASASARDLLSGAEMVRRIPPAVWEALAREPAGRPVGFQPQASRLPPLLIRRHGHTEGEWLVLIEADPSALRSRQVLSQAACFETLGCMAAGISRELLEPLERIADAAGRARDRLHALGEDRARATVSELEAACQRQLQSIVALLDFVERGPTAGTDVSLSDCFARVHAGLRDELRAGNHRIAYAVDDGADGVHAHRVAVDFILRQVICNALEAGEGAATVQVRARVEPGRGRVRVQMDDRGPGVPASQRAHLFEPMCTTKAGHAGLGLASSRALARDLGGELEHVHVPRGARFVLMLPIATGPVGGRS